MAACDGGGQGSPRRSQVVRIDDLDLCIVRQSLGQHHERSDIGGDCLPGRTVHSGRKCLRKVCRSAVAAPRIGTHGKSGLAIDVFERDLRDFSGQHLIARSKSDSGEDMAESQRHGAVAATGQVAGDGDAQILLVGDGRGNAVRDFGSTGGTLVRERDARPAVGRVGEESDLLPAGPEVVRRPAGCLRDLDIVHIVRPAGILAPRLRISRRQHAERIVESILIDGCGACLRLFGVRTARFDAVGDRRMQEQRVGRRLALQRKDARVLRSVGRLLCGAALRRRGLPAVRTGDLEAQFRPRKGVVRRRVFRAGGDQKHDCRRGCGKKSVV